MNPPQGVRVAHPDGTHTPVEVRYVDSEPREIDGEIYIVEIWEATQILNWNPGDHLETDHLPGPCVIRTHRVGVR